MRTVTREELIEELVLLITDLFADNWNHVGANETLPCGLTVRAAAWKLRNGEL